jgi:hypothetical protein
MPPPIPRQRIDYANGTYYDGRAVVNGKANGDGYLHNSSNDEIIYIGHFKDDMFDGEGTLFTEPNFMGIFKNGKKKNGRLLLNNFLIYEGPFDENEFPIGPLRQPPPRPPRRVTARRGSRTRRSSHASSTSSSSSPRTRRSSSASSTSSSSSPRTRRSNSASSTSSSSSSRDRDRRSSHASSTSSNSSPRSTGSRPRRSSIASEEELELPELDENEGWQDHNLFADEEDEVIDPFTGIAYEVHNAYDEIDMHEYLTIIGKTITDKNNHLYTKEITNYVFQNFEKKIKELFPENEQKQLIIQLKAILNKSRAYINHQNDDIKIQIGKTVDYVLQQEDEFIKSYLELFIETCYNAYPDSKPGEGISCPKGIRERIFMILGQVLFLIQNPKRDELLNKVFGDNILDPLELLKEWNNTWNEFKKDKDENDTSEKNPDWNGKIWKKTPVNQRRINFKAFMRNRLTGYKDSNRRSKVIDELAEANEYVFENVFDPDVTFGGAIGGAIGGGRRRKKRKTLKKVKKVRKRTVKKYNKGLTKKKRMTMTKK